MNTLRLPEIEPAAPVPGAAEAFDRLGARFERATDAISGVMLEAQKAQTSAQAQEAALKVAAAQNDVTQTVKNNPYVSPEWVKQQFGGNVPEGVRLTEQQTVPGSDTPQEVDRSLIPMHEVAPLLYDQHMGAAADNAAKGIEAKGHQDTFRRSAAADIEKGRAHVMEWQGAQMLADAAIKTVAQIQQAAAMRNWALYTAILDNPHNQLELKERESLRAALPGLQTKAEVEDRLRSRDPEELKALSVDIASNRNFTSPLSAEQQLQYSTMAQARIHEIRTEQEHEEKRAAEKRFEAFGDGVQQAVNASIQTGRPLSQFIGVSDIPVDMKFDEFTKFKAFMDAMGNRERQTDNRVWAQLSELDKAGKLVSLSRAQMMQFWPGLSETDQRTWMDRWSKAQSPDGAKSMFSEVEDATMNRVLENHYKIDPKKDPDLFSSAKVQLQRNLIVWRKAHPEEPMLYDTVRQEARTTTFTAPTEGSFFGLLGPTNEKSWLKKFLPEADARDAWMTLNQGIRATGQELVSDQDVLDHLKQMNGEKPLVEEAWKKLIGATTPLDGTARATIHSVLINPVEMQRVKDALTKEGKPADNQRNQIYRIVQDMQPPQAREYAAKVESDATAEAQRAAKETVVKQGAAAHRIESDGDAIARQESERIARARFSRLPYWEQGAQKWIEGSWKDTEAAVEDQIRERVRAEFTAKYGARKVDEGTNFDLTTMSRVDAGGAVATEMKKRVEAEVAAGRAERRADFDTRIHEDMDAFRSEVARVGANPDLSVFLKFMQNRRRAEVR